MKKNYHKIHITSANLALKIVEISQISGIITHTFRNISQHE